MAARLRYDFPPEIVAERNRLFERMRQLLAEQTYDAAREANRLHLEWLAKYPDDALALEAGEVLGMTLGAYETEQAPIPTRVS